MLSITNNDINITFKRFEENEFKAVDIDFKESSLARMKVVTKESRNKGNFKFPAIKLS